LAPPARPRGQRQRYQRTSRRYKVVYNSSSLSGQIAAVESGLAAAVLTQCSAPPHLQILGREQQLGPLEPMAVALYRSRASKESLAVVSLYESLLRTLRTSAADTFAYRDPEQR
ncbi:hypothetical protein B5P41_31720, partial [Bacillus sp. SRB_28]